ncbi:MAG: bifunctional phosphoribosyl-AMP cyclohydrolase/phosphoribosyl-ATP diphosphatase HisIE [Bacteroidales bacterium]
MEKLKDKVFKNETDLIPAVIQDDKSLKVLMLGYMNRESFDRSMECGLVTFYSRSKGRLWTKGETSGNFLKIKSIETDCDSDTLLLRVDPAGPVCHTGSVSCFKGRDSEGFVNRLEAVVQQRHNEMPSGSYTTSLFNAGVEKICKKLGEEAAETIIEVVKGDKKRVVYESSDLIYHLLVLLEYCNLSFRDIEEELYSRHRKE